jgi:hypothetical protein
MKIIKELIIQKNKNNSLILINCKIIILSTIIQFNNKIKKEIQYNLTIIKWILAIKNN